MRSTRHPLPAGPLLIQEPTRICQYGILQGFKADENGRLAIWLGLMTSADLFI